MAVSFIRDHPELRPFLLQNARPTGVVIGDGSYGSVVELEIPGAKCAAKKIHDFPRPEKDAARRDRKDFERVRPRVSTDEHPSPSSHRAVPGSVLLARLANAGDGHGEACDRTPRNTRPRATAEDQGVHPSQPEMLRPTRRG